MNETPTLSAYLLENAKRVSSDEIQVYLICNATAKLLKAVIPDIEDIFKKRLMNTITEGLKSMQEKQ